MKVVLSIRDNQGYTADQVNSQHTLADLRDRVEDAIEFYGEDAEIVTFNLNNPRGASWGNISIDYGMDDAEEFEAPEDW